MAQLATGGRAALGKIVEQFYQTIQGQDEAERDGTSASRKVSRGIMRALEQGRLVPGQRLVETSLAVEYGVGRNAVREAVQWLAAHGVIDVTRHRSASIRWLDAAETQDVLEVAEAVLGLLLKAAARNFQPARHGARLRAGLEDVAQAVPGVFARARRHFYAALLEISGSRELHRLFPAIGLHVLLAQYRAVAAMPHGLDMFRAMAEAVANNDVEHAQALGRAHISQLRQIILQFTNHEPFHEKGNAP